MEGENKKILIPLVYNMCGNREKLNFKNKYCANMTHGKTSAVC